jgi:hypothetical protein
MDVGLQNSEFKLLTRFVVAAERMADALERLASNGTPFPATLPLTGGIGFPMPGTAGDFAPPPAIGDPPVYQPVIMSSGGGSISGDPRLGVMTMRAAE